MTPTYFANLHDEAMALLIESRNYIQELRRDKKIRSVDGAVGLNANFIDLSVETMRLTSRLTQVMAWMLAQRAVSSGEITAEEGASDRFRLSGQEVCLQHDLTNSSHIPLRLCDLLQRSYDLYLRVSRLEAQIGQRLTEESAAIVPRTEDCPAPQLQLLAPRTSDQDPQNAY